jgi:hypothetical protein
MVLERAIGQRRGRDAVLIGAANKVAA